MSAAEQLIPLDAWAERRPRLVCPTSRPCVACGAHDGTVVLAHYIGPRRHSYGGGMSHKGHDLIGAHLCATCHADMDRNQRSKANRWEVSEIFLHYCALTLIRLWDQGKLKT